MKKNLLLLLFVASLGLVSCEKSDDGKYADYLVAKPLTISKSEFKNSVDVVAPAPIKESGKIYAYRDYIFVNDKYRGVHVIDNSDPSAPKKISFIKIAGNVDISIKDGYLYADSLTDLVVLDISDITHIKIVTRLDNVLRDNVVWPAADFYEYDGLDYDNEVLLGWETVTERRLVTEFEERFTVDGEFFANAETVSDASVGQGGSLARFKIVGDYLCR